MTAARDNVALIGMPGAGKSTLGVLLAGSTARVFVYTDLCIQEAEGVALARLIVELGGEGFRKIEERCVLALECSGSVIATGGSVVYSEPAMEHLGRIAWRVYLDVPLAKLERRLGDLDTRGAVRTPGQSLESLLLERRPLYEDWCDVRVDCNGLQHDGVVRAIHTALEIR